MDNPAESNVGRVVVEYENLDIPPAYVESVQGAPSPHGVLHASFFSERIKGLETLSGTMKVREGEEGRTSISSTIADPFGMDGEELRVIRRVEANLIFTPDAIERLIPWLQQHLDAMRKKEAQS